MLRRHDRRHLLKCAGEEWSEIDDAGSDPSFVPDLKPNDLKEQYNNLYARMGDRLAGMKSWPKEWMPPGSNQLGWLDWYYGYMDGTRTGDDDHQIKRWKSFKSRHLSQFLKNPTPRRAYALRNWAIDPLVYLDDDAASLMKKHMKEYRDAKFSKAAAVDENAAHLKTLLDAKSHSDNKRYGQKHFLIQRSMTERPDEWVIDSPGGPHPGVTHVPTGFRLHMASSKIPPNITIDKTYALSQPDISETIGTQEKIAAFDRAELQALAQYLNKEQNAGLPLNVPNSQLEQHILDFIEGEGGVNPGLLEIGVEGAEAARKDVQKLNTQATPQPQQTSVWADVAKTAASVTDTADVWDADTKSFHEVNVPDILEQVKGRDPETIGIDEVWGGFESSPGFSEERVAAADTNYPIVLDDYTEGEGFRGGLVDGRHRRIKLKREGADSVNAIKLTPEDIKTLIAKLNAPKQASYRAQETQPATFDELMAKVASEGEMLRKRIREGTKEVEEPKSKDQARAGNYKKGFFAKK